MLAQVNMRVAVVTLEIASAKKFICLCIRMFA
jgi:hypothetical protein